MKFRYKALAVSFVLPLMPAQASSRCALSATQVLPEGVKLYQNGSRTLGLYTSQLRRDDDGAANAYHPCGNNHSDGVCLDAYGLDHICSGVAVLDADGHHVPPSELIIKNGKRVRSSERCLATFRAAEAADFPNCGTGKPCVNGWPGLVLKTRQAAPGFEIRIPEIRPEGSPYAGYYISQTTLGRPDDNVPGATSYLDARKIPYIVVPGHSVLTKGAWRLGSSTVADLAMVVERQPNNEAFAVFALVGDIGPAGETGEGSVALLGRLQGATPDKLSAERPTASALPNRTFKTNPTIVVFRDAGRALKDVWPAHDLTPKDIANGGRQALTSALLASMAGCGAIPSDLKHLHFVTE